MTRRVFHRREHQSVRRLGGHPHLAYRSGGLHARSLVPGTARRRLSAKRAGGGAETGTFRHPGAAFPLEPALPVEHEDALLERLRAAEPSCLRDPLRARPSRRLRGGRASSRRRPPCVRSRPSSARRRCLRRPSSASISSSVAIEPSRVGIEKSRIGLERYRAGGSTSGAYGSSSPSCVRSTKSVTPAATRSRTSTGAFSGPHAQGWRPAMSAAGLDDGGRAHDAEVCHAACYPVRGDRLIRRRAGADSRRMARLETSASELRDRALVLAAELGVDPGAWYVRVLEEGRAAGDEPDLGALVRVYWELQRVDRPSRSPGHVARPRGPALVRRSCLTRPV